MGSVSRRVVYVCMLSIVYNEVNVLNSGLHMLYIST